ncbi:MAG: GAF domain-containing protein [Roseiflexus sp.]|nr:GAF domain-containing protein [Roseiflexus sp.]MCS7289598.1 GAF domain-containing protein [Roseiflexus sp.]MDW8146384.1 GAF domain-containing protein [Roseiflexaceae bacterium]
MHHDLTVRRVLSVIQRATQTAAQTNLAALLDRTLDLFVEEARAEAGTLYLYDPERDELVVHVVKGDETSQRLLGMRIPASRGVAGAALRAREPIFVSNVADDPRWDRSTGELASLQLRTMYCLPLMIEDRPVGVVQVFNPPADAIDADEELTALRVLGDVMVSVIDKTRLLEEIYRRERRQRALADIAARLTTTLDRQQLLTLIMDYARELLNCEATSVWEIDDEDEANPVLRSHVATGSRGEKVAGITVPFGQGIIGHVVATGQVIRVDDVRNDARHYQAVDQQSGFVTRSILCVPLHAPSIQLGKERGRVEARIIGGAQALNKIGGPFTDDDVALFESFASLAATVLQLSRLYAETQNLLLGMIKALVEAVDARDRNNQHHSRRVSDFSVAIAEELGLSDEQIFHVRIGSLLHDIGKIGVPDAILDKPGRLTDEELIEMRSHTIKGYEIMSQEELRRLLRVELPALLQHHERLDGNGYPHRIAGDQISWIARIVAVADVFDALTSARPYKAPWSAEQAIAYLNERKGIEFDAACVEALARARAKGHPLVKTQIERAALTERR